MDESDWAGYRQDEEAHRAELKALVARMRKGMTTNEDADRVEYELHLTEERHD